LTFNQNIFNILCSDLNAMKLSRAAAASSAVPVVLSPVTINNYGGSCQYTFPRWAKPFIDSAAPPRPAARAIRQLKEAEAYDDGTLRPYIHLVDGGISDNLGVRGVLDGLEFLEAVHDAGGTTVLDQVRRVVIFVVNSLSTPPTTWDRSESPPGTLDILLKATGVPIDHYSYEAVELLKDISARWQNEQRLRKLAECDKYKDSPVCVAIRVPNADLYAVDVSFAGLNDKKEVEYLNEQPTSFVLPSEAVDRLRAAAGTIILDSPEFKRLLKDVGATLVSRPGTDAGAASRAAR